MRYTFILIKTQENLRSNAPLSSSISTSKRNHRSLQSSNWVFGEARNWYVARKFSYLNRPRFEFFNTNRKKVILHIILFPIWFFSIDEKSYDNVYWPSCESESEVSKSLRDKRISSHDWRSYRLESRYHH